MKRPTPAALVLLMVCAVGAEAQTTKSQPAAKAPAAKSQAPAAANTEQQTKALNLSAYAELLRSDVRAQVQVYVLTPAGRQLIDTIEVDAKSGLAPGMAETMGVGGLTGHLLVSTVVGGGLHVADEAIGADVVADADRAAKGIAKQLSALFAREGWTS